MFQYKKNALGITERNKLEVAQMNIEAINATAEIAFVVMAESGAIDDVTAGEHMEIFAPWKSGVDYVPGNLRVYPEYGEEQKLYRCNQPHTSQIDWTPDKTPALWTLTSDPAEEWPEWSQPIGAHDAYNAGDKCSHNNMHWVSDMDGNIWEPGVFGWHVVSE